MGLKYDAGDQVFDPVMDQLLLLKREIGEEALQRVASGLIGGLLELGWGNADASLGRYDGEPAIVAAFRGHGIVLACPSEHAEHGGACDEERGHAPAIVHRDYQGRTWTNEEAVR